MSDTYKWNGKLCTITGHTKRHIGAMQFITTFHVEFADGSKQDVSADDFRGAQLQNTAAHLAKFEELLQHPEYSHVSYRISVGQAVLNVYKRDSSSPTGCIGIGGAMDDDAAQALLVKHGRRAGQGGLRGEMASRAMMTGRV